MHLFSSPQFAILQSRNHAQAHAKIIICHSVMFLLIHDMKYPTIYCSPSIQIKSIISCYFHIMNQNNLFIIYNLKYGFKRKKIRMLYVLASAFKINLNVIYVQDVVFNMLQFRRFILIIIRDVKHAHNHRYCLWLLFNSVCFIIRFLVALKIFFFVDRNYACQDTFRQFLFANSM